MDIAADTGLPVISDIRIFFRSALKIFPFESLKTSKKTNSLVTARQASRIFDFF